MFHSTSRVIDTRIFEKNGIRFKLRITENQFPFFNDYGIELFKLKKSGVEKCVYSRCHDDWNEIMKLYRRCVSDTKDVIKRDKKQEKRMRRLYK